MTPLAKIKNRCRIDDITGCWIWTGAVRGSNGGLTRMPNVYSEDYTADPTGNTKKTQTGNRAAWHAITGQPIPEGHRVFKAPCCSEGLCVNPGHMACGTTAQWGKSVTTRGNCKGSHARIQANRALGRSKSHVTAEIAQEIRSSPETGRALSSRLDISESVISRVRTGQLLSVLAVQNPFAGLMT